ncbi:PhnD/SsuA/transferrin family substrate-binding protein [Sulfurimonas marina]|uniref:ABC transporter substrate-binding protein n=1 Tax=Sulfurimonas marina TaxID=2590551 RepID=A0A7M1AWM5_9BACT|nr:PhnD/SsuA/transferrin family substrate-binding protein [Sulfurimonas marina]QOP41849.1 ABC transporter substrate-binding protein [Sulfurimonas marina]
MSLVKRVVLLMIVLSTSLLATQKRDINFTPLPMKNEQKTIQGFVPFIEYLQQHTSLTINFNYQHNYSDILKGFIEGKIDIAYLGPLPYAVLKSKYPEIEPLVTFKQKDGKSFYRCVLSKFSEDQIDFEKKITVALTQPLSTCGYYATNKLLKDKLGIALEKQSYAYTMSHTNALLGVMREEFMIAGATEDIAKQYESLGMEIIAESELFPGFAIVVNKKTLSSEQIAKIREILLNIPKTTYEKWDPSLKYGVVPADVNLYNSLNIDCDIPQEGNME